PARISPASAGGRRASSRVGPLLIPDRRREGLAAAKTARRWVRRIRPPSPPPPQLGMVGSSPEGDGSFDIGHIVQSVDSLGEPRRQTVYRHPLGEFGRGA